MIPDASMFFLEDAESHYTIQCQAFVLKHGDPRQLLFINKRGTLLVVPTTYLLKDTYIFRYLVAGSVVTVHSIPGCTTLENVLIIK